MHPEADLGLTGKVIDARFRVERFVGRGELSAVYRGMELEVGRPVAIKFLAPPAGTDTALFATYFQRFREGSQAHRAVAEGCPHIAPILEIGTIFSAGLSAQIPYFVRDWYEGVSLDADLRARRARGETGRSLLDMIELLDPGAQALIFAHKKRFVHERVNPQAFFVADVLGLKMVDFGVARALYPTARDRKEGGAFAESTAFLPYVAPEQVDASLGVVGPATDVYALALLILELLADRPAVQTPGDLAASVLDPNARPTPARMGIVLPRAAEDVLVQAVALAPTDRPRDARELWEALRVAAGLTAGPEEATAPIILRDRGNQATMPDLRPVMPELPDDDGRDEPTAETEIDEGGEEFRKAVGPLLPPTALHLEQEPSIIVKPSIPPPPPDAVPAVTPAPMAVAGASAARDPLAASARARTVRLRAPEPTVRLVRRPPPSPWSYAFVSLLTAGVVVGVALGGRALLERARAKAAGPEGSATVTSTAPSASSPSVEASSSAASATSAASAGGAPPSSSAARVGAGAAEADAGAAPKPFDTDAAHLALDAVAGSADCKIPKTKPCHVKVTFAPEGSVTSAVVQAPYIGMPQGACLAKHLKEARVPAFVGGPVTLTFPSVTAK